MKKILIVSDYLDNIWWIESYIANLKNILADEYEIYYFWWKNISWLKKLFYLFFSYFNFIYAKKFRKKIDEIKPDIIWFHSVSRFLGPSVVEQVRNYSDIIKIQTYHDLWYFSIFASKIYDLKDLPNKFSFIEFFKKTDKNYLYVFYIIFKYLKLKKLRNVLRKNIDIHTVPSEFMKNYVIKLWYWENVRLLLNFVLKDYLVDRQDKYQDKINFIYFWRLEKEKWFWVFLHFLSDLWDLKYKNSKKYYSIISKIRIFIFWDGKYKSKILDSFIWEDINGKDISILKDLSNEDNIDLDNILEKDNKFIYYFWNRQYEQLRQYLSISHFNIVPSLFLETFWLSAVEWAINGVIPIWFDKPNINTFLLDNYKLKSDTPLLNFSDKMFDIIDNYNYDNWKKESEENKNLVEKFVI